MLCLDAVMREMSLQRGEIVHLLPEQDVCVRLIGASESTVAGHLLQLLSLLMVTTVKISCIDGNNETTLRCKKLLAASV